MLVEDDKSLREIYGVRLLAEGYDIVSAGDGEEALAMAIKERPQLIISDVMMPKVSGYDMLDILRSTTETKNIRVIMMTALSSEEQRTRAESLGADRYLVKSQVGIEDVVRVVHEVLGDAAAAAPAEPPAAAPAQPATPTPTPVAPTPIPTPTPVPTPPVTPAAPSVPSPAPVAPPVTVQSPVAPTPAAAPSQPAAPAPTPQAPAAEPVTPQPVSTPAEQPSEPQPVEPEPAVRPPEPPKPASLKTRVIQPLNDPNISPIDINELLNKELAKEASLTGSEIPTIPTAAEEKALVEQQIESFRPPEPTPVEAPAPPAAVPAPEPLMPTPGVNSDPMAMPNDIPVVEPDASQPAANQTPPTTP